MYRGISEITSGRSPSSLLVPCVIVTGRSVLSRNVKQGTWRYVVSSWMPPESVNTAAADECEEVDVPDWIRELHARGVKVLAVQPRTSPRMNRKHNRQATSDLGESRKDRRK